MIYELILQPEAEQHLEELKKSGQKKILKKDSGFVFRTTDAPNYWHRAS